jgi:hypothetical protein
MAVSQPSTICPIRAHVSLISSKYPTWCRSTFEPCRHDLIHAFVYPSCSIIQENIIFDRANDRFNLEVLTTMGDVILDIGTRESSFSFGASDRVGLRRWSNEEQHKWSHEAQPDSIRCYVAHSRKEKLHERLRSLPLSNCPNIVLSLWSRHPSSFLVLPTSHHKSRDEIFFKGEVCNTMCY